MRRSLRRTFFCPEVLHSMRNAKNACGHQKQKFELGPRQYKISLLATLQGEFYIYIHMVKVSCQKNIHAIPTMPNYYEISTEIIILLVIKNRCNIMIIQTVSMQWTHHIFCYFVFRIHLSKFLFWPLSFCWRWLERDIFNFQVYFSIFKRKFTKLLLICKKQGLSRWVEQNR